MLSIDIIGSVKSKVGVIQLRKAIGSYSTNYIRQPVADE